MEQETEMKRQEENFSVEPDDIHQKMYEIATKNQSTTLHLDPPGGSETFNKDLVVGLLETDGSNSLVDNVSHITYNMWVLK